MAECYGCEFNEGMPGTAEGMKCRLGKDRLAPYCKARKSRASAKKGVIQRYRPPTWDELIPGLVEECIKAGEIQIEESEREKITAFIRYCLNVGADALLEGVRVMGIDALVKKGLVYQVASKIAVPGRPQFIKTNMSFKDKKTSDGPGRLVFIPADKDKFVIPPGTLQGKN